VGSLRINVLHDIQELQTLLSNNFPFLCRVYILKFKGGAS
jgi:hypothetical protein